MRKLSEVTRSVAILSLPQIYSFLVFETLSWVERMWSRGGHFQHFLGFLSSYFFLSIFCVLLWLFKKSIRYPFAVCIVLLLLLEEVAQVPACSLNSKVSPCGKILKSLLRYTSHSTCKSNSGNLYFIMYVARTEDLSAVCKPLKGYFVLFISKIICLREYLL